MQRKADTAYKNGLADCAHYFERLGNFVLDGIGPTYQASDLISDELYSTWLSIVNQPNCRTEIKRPDRIGFPYSVMWYGVVRDGNRYVRVEFSGAEYPALLNVWANLPKAHNQNARWISRGPRAPIQLLAYQVVQVAGDHCADK